jgi:hypothetical protein
MSIGYTFTKETMETVEFLEDDRGQILDRAVRNVLGTEVALLTYAQILDGLPTEQSLLDSTDVCTRCKDHPVLAMKHNEICPGFVEKAREFRARFDIAVLEFELKVWLFLSLPLAALTCHRPSVSSRMQKMVLKNSSFVS